MVYEYRPQKTGVDLSIVGLHRENQLSVHERFENK